MCKVNSIYWPLLTMVVVVCMATVCSSGGSDPPPKTVKAEDLENGKYVIMGRLGKPYGEVFKVRGVYEETGRNKGFGSQLRITHIDGRELGVDQQIIYEIFCVGWLEKPRAGTKIGDVIECRAFESGGYCILQAKILEVLKKPPNQDPRGFGFHSHLHLFE